MDQIESKSHSHHNITSINKCSYLVTKYFNNLHTLGVRNVILTYLYSNDLSDCIFVYDYASLPVKINLTFYGHSFTPLLINRTVKKASVFGSKEGAILRSLNWADNFKIWLPYDCVSIVDWLIKADLGVLIPLTNED